MTMKDEWGQTYCHTRVLSPAKILLRNQGSLAALEFSTSGTCAVGPTERGSESSPANVSDVTPASRWQLLPTYTMMIMPVHCRGRERG